uniref:cobalt-precorrin-6A reductase n=1 Tax=Vaginimicrobium propionicum TaxID=1871034 RepID=UPI0009711A91|nr:cobalt-precorrin-6A reductase [Vaginimicrobium propionicum]
MLVLLLGGTRDATEIAAQLRLLPSTEVIVSVAGRTKLAAGDRVGGFGGVAGLRDYLATNQVNVVVDATHPFAERMSANAALACAEIGVGLVRFLRPGWHNHPHADSWVWVANHDEAAKAAAIGGRVLLTVGRQSLGHYVGLPDVIARVAEDDGTPVPASWRVLASRGPFSLADERKLLADNHVKVLVSKDSGGQLTSAKLDAARELGVTVIMVARPPTPAGVTEVNTVAGVIDFVRAQAQP